MRELQKALDAAWAKDPQKCEREGYPRQVKDLDPWQLTCLRVSLGVLGGK